MEIKDFVDKIKSKITKQTEGENEKNISEKVVNTLQKEVINADIPKPDDWKVRKAQELNTLFDDLKIGTNKIVSDKQVYIKFLDFLTHLNKNSIANLILIFNQNKTAIKLVDMDYIKENKLIIKQGEKSIKILEPSTQYIRKNGTVGINYEVKKLFDVSQLNKKVNIVEDSLCSQKEYLLALLANKPYEMIVSQELQSEDNAIFDSEAQKIVIKKDLSKNDLFIALLKVYADILLHKDNIDNKILSNSVAYIVSKKYGFDVDSFNFENLEQTFTENDDKQIRQKLKLIKDVSNVILLNMYNYFKKNNHER